MKKKLLTLILLCAMVLSTSLLAFAGDNVTGSDAVKADPAKVLVIDVRSAENYAKGSLANSVNWPLFDANGVTNGADALAQAFTKSVEDNAALLADKELYILCNSGAQNATALLKAAGYDESKIHTITNGAKSLEIRYAFLNTNQTVPNDDAVAAIGGTEAVVIDVRNDANYNKASLKGALHIPVFTDTGVVQTNEDELAKAFIAATKDNAELAGKKIYILCNSGQSGARAATVLLTDAGYTPDMIYTIEGGAKGVSNLEFRYGMLGTNNAVSGADAVASIGNGKVVVLDVRNEATYNKGYLEGSIHLPVFDETNTPVSTAKDDLAVAFIETAKNTKELEGQDIYVLCNGGARGARAATVLLTDAGYKVENIYTITNGAKDEDVKSAFTTYKFVDGAKAVKADPAKTFIIDVRTEANFKKGTLANAVNWPLFDANGVTNGADDLAKAFKDAVNANRDAIGTKDIYILCNSGARGAQNATTLLGELGYNTNLTADGKVYTIKYGATGIDVRYAFLDASKFSTVSGKDTVAAIGNEKVLILDVRALPKYGAGHLKGSLSLPVFSPAVVNSTKDALSVAFTDYVKANLETMKAYEHIYIVCNSGQSGARAATVLLTDAGIDLTKISTVTGGAKGTTDDMSVPNALTYASGEYVMNMLGQEGYLVLDVRSADKYAAGHLKGSLSLPVFDKDNNLPDDLAEKFLAYVNANKADFEGKTIYVLCNSGARGAAKAIELLTQAGVNAKVFTIENGAKSVVKDFFVVERPASPKTGDASTVMLYAFAMVAAVVVITRKREYSK